jgi:hypothetical protein
VMVKRRMSSFTVLQYSITPVLKVQKFHHI